LAVVFALGVVFSLTSSSGVTASQQVTLTVIHPWAGDERELFLPVLRAAEEALGITIEDKTMRTEDLKVLLPTQWAAATAPGDVIFLTDTALLRKGGEEGHIPDVSGLINVADFVPGSIDPVAPYAAPYTQKPKPGFWYRKSFFAEHGLSVPTTPAEFIVLLRKLKGIEGLEAPIASGDEVGWPLSDVTEHFLVAYGGYQLHKDLASCKATEDQWLAVKAIFDAMLTPKLEAGHFGEPIEWTTALTRWWEGAFGIYFQGIWILGMDPVKQNPEDAGVFTIPGTTGVVSSVDYLFVNNYSANLEKAKELFQWLVTEGQVVQVQQGGHVATYIPAQDPALYPGPERSVIEAIGAAVPLTDLDDTIGGGFQRTFWDQLKLLWVAPDRADEVIQTIREAWDAACGGS
jgi:multiple sugar transport system substrate-binding protein